MDDDHLPDRLPAGITHAGRFLHATCPQCAWRGPARRAVHSAEVDAATHRLEHVEPPPVATIVLPGHLTAPSTSRPA